MSSERRGCRMVFHGVRMIPSRKEVHIQIAIAGNHGAVLLVFFVFLNTWQQQVIPARHSCTSSRLYYFNMCIYFFQHYHWAITRQVNCVCVRVRTRAQARRWCSFLMQKKKKKSFSNWPSTLCVAAANMSGSCGDSLLAPALCRAY